MKDVVRKTLLTCQAAPSYRWLGRKTVGAVVDVRGLDDADIRAFSRYFRVSQHPERRQYVDRVAVELRSPRPNSVHVIALCLERIIGHVVVTRNPDDQSRFPGLWLFALNVWLPFRGLGIAERLVETAASLAPKCDADRLYLRVAAYNVPALALYRKLGFEPAEVSGHTEILDRLLRERGRREIILSRPLSPIEAGLDE